MGHGESNHLRSTYVAANTLHIIVTKRMDDWMAQWSEEPCTWECGPTREHAVGKLVQTLSRTHPEVVKITPDA